MRTLTTLFAAAALLTPALAFAQATSGSSMTSSEATSGKHKVDMAQEGAVVSVRKDGKICRKKTETGSRLGGHTDCRTKAEWDEVAHNARQDMELHQQRGINKN